MADDAGDSRLADLERKLRFQTASGVYDRWIEVGEELSGVPPWYEAALEIVRLRVSVRGEDPSVAARSLFRAELIALEARLSEALRRSRHKDDWVAYQFGEIRQLITLPSGGPEERFVAFVVNAPAGPVASDQTTAVPGRADPDTPAHDSQPVDHADCDDYAAENVEAENPPQSDPIAAERKGLLEAYQSEGVQRGVRITDKMIAEAASKTWHDRTPVQRWKRNDPKCTKAEDAKIRAVLKNKPHLK